MKTKKRRKSVIAKVGKSIQKLFKRKLLRKKSSRHALRSFFVVVMTACTGSLFIALAMTKPTVDPKIRATLSTHSVTVDAASGRVGVGAIDQAGLASWYALGLPAPEALTCASRTFPRGTYLDVVNLNNQASVTCLVNDYGPEAWTGRVIDMSLGSARVLGMVSSGTVPVTIKIVPQPVGAINLVTPSSFARTAGYSWCTAKYTESYCEAHRQDTSN